MPALVARLKAMLEAVVCGSPLLKIATTPGEVSFLARVLESAGQFSIPLQTLTDSWHN
jgi:hypothetical protein